MVEVSRFFFAIYFVLSVKQKRYEWRFQSVYYDSARELNRGPPTTQRIRQPPHHRAGL